MITKAKRRFAAVAVALLAFCGATVMSVPSASAASGTISGNIQCGYDNNQVVGVWVNANSGTDGWATTWDDGMGGKNYSYNLSQSSNYTLHVGCGGTPSSWKATFYTPNVGGQYYNWICTYGASTGFKFACFS